jgi:multiple antibiotic resistance protein
LIGEAVLGLLGTSLGAFRVGGGLVLLLVALAMLHMEAGNLRAGPQDAPAGPQQ